MNVRVLWSLFLGTILGSIVPATAAPVYELIHEFGSQQNAPRNPAAALIPGTDGNFYGTSAKGGTGGHGTIFRLSPAGQITVLVNFTGTSGAALGSMPSARLIRARDGALYGTTMRGGPTNYGTIFKVTEQGQFTNLLNFDRGSGGNDYGIGGYPAGHLLQASDGNFYGMTTIGAAVDDGAVFRFTPGQGLTNLYTFYTRSAEGGLVEGTDGALYGATSLGGNANNGELFKVTKAGQVTVLTDFMTPEIYELGYRPTGGVARGKDGNIYVMTYFSTESYPGSLIRITPGQQIKKILDWNYTVGSGLRSEPVQGADGSFYTLANLFFGSLGPTCVVRANPVTTTLTKVVTFSDIGGEAPGSGVSSSPQGTAEALGRGGLVAAEDGNLYGTLYSGGFNQAGVAFRLFFGTKGKTTDATEVTHTQATLHAQINQGLNPGTVFFQYGTTPDLSGVDTLETSPEAVPAGDSSVPFTVSLSSLQRGTTYYYRVSTTSPQGNRNGEILSFTTDAGQPAISEVSVKDVTLHSASVNCVVNPRGLSTEVRVEWSTAGGNPISSSPQILPAGEAPVALEFSVPELTRGVTYDFMVIAESSAGRSTVEGTFTTVRTHSPVASDDSVTISRLKPIVLAVLENDSDIDNDELTITSCTAPQAGVVRLWGKALLYVPDSRFNGEDSFRYTIDDGFGGTASAEVVIRHREVLKGLYNALVKTDDKIGGFLQIALSAKGGFTGTITLDNERRAFSGVINEDGSSVITLRRPGARTWEIQFTVPLTGELGTWEGTVSDGTRTLSFHGNRAAAPGGIAIRPGQFNCFLTVGAPDTQATGWGVLTVAETHAARFSGRLPDGTPFSAAASQINADGTVTVFAVSSGAQRHQIIGDIVLGQDDPVSVQSGSNLKWVRPQSDEVTPAVTALSCEGSRWTVVAPGDLPLYFAIPARLHLVATLGEGGQFDTGIPIRTLSGRVAGGNTADAVFQVNSKNGLFSGVFRDPTTHRRIPYKGIIRQDKQIGRGYWGVTPSTKAVQIAPMLPEILPD